LDWGCLDWGCLDWGCLDRGRGEESIEPLRQGQRVNRLDPIKNFDRLDGFIALQMTNQVPGDIREVLEARFLLSRIQDPTFTKVSDASGIGRAHGPHVRIFSHGDNPNRRGDTGLECADFIHELIEFGLTRDWMRRLHCT
jgi:hypothetical protein